MREKQIREKIELERQENAENVMKKFMSRAALLRKITAQDEKVDKENHAAVVIQTCKQNIFKIISPN